MRRRPSRLAVILFQSYCFFVSKPEKNAFGALNVFALYYSFAPNLVLYVQRTMYIQKARVFLASCEHCTSAPGTHFQTWMVFLHVRASSWAFFLKECHACKRGVAIGWSWGSERPKRRKAESTSPIFSKTWAAGPLLLKSQHVAPLQRLREDKIHVKSPERP